MKYILRLPYFIEFVLFYLKELLLSNVKVLRDVLRPSMNFQPAIILLPLDTTNDFQVLVLANLISMTPGTLSVDVSNDRKALYIHSMYGEDIDGLKQSLKDSFEKRIIRLFG